MELDFSRMRYQIHNMPKDQTVLQAHPELCKYPEFKQEGVENLDKLIRYTMFAYDRYSPLHRVAADDVRKRKRLALDKAGFNGKSNYHSEEYLEEIIYCKNVFANMMAVRYIRICGDVKFSLLMSRYDNFHSSMFLLSSNKTSMLGGDQLKEAAQKTIFAESLSKEADAIAKLAAEVFFDEAELITVADDMVQNDDGFIGVVERYSLPSRK